jgi:hypothetical protein
LLWRGWGRVDSLFKIVASRVGRAKSEAATSNVIEKGKDRHFTNNPEGEKKKIDGVGPFEKAVSMNPIWRRKKGRKKNMVSSGRFLSKKGGGGQMTPPVVGASEWYEYFVVFYFGL